MKSPNTLTVDIKELKAEVEAAHAAGRRRRWIWPLLSAIRLKVIDTGWPKKRETSEEPETTKTNAFHRYDIFCCGETPRASVAGTLETLLPLERGHVHVIKGRRWRCVNVHIHSKGAMADFRPAPASGDGK